MTGLQRLSITMLMATSVMVWEIPAQSQEEARTRYRGQIKRQTSTWPLYNRGTRAAKEQKWGLLKQLMEDAIALSPYEDEDGIQPGSRRGVFAPYVPYYYLGLACYRLGELRCALDAWQESEKFGALNDRALRKEHELQGELLPDLRRDFRLASDLRAAEGRIAEAEAAGGAVFSKLKSSGFIDQQSQANDFEQATSFVEAARTALEQARSRSEGAQAETAVSLADRALAAFNRLDREVDQRLIEERRAEADAIRGAEERIARADEVARALDVKLGTAGRPGAQLPMTEVVEARRVLDTAKRRLGEARDGSGRTAAMEASSMANQAEVTFARIDRELDQLQALPAPPLSSAAPLALQPRPETLDQPPVEPTPATVLPASLRRAAEDYFNARYENALQSLDDPDGFDGKMRVQLHWFRAAARFGMYIISGLESVDLLEAAQRDARRCIELDPSFEPNSSYFSPRIIQLFRDAIG